VITEVLTQNELAKALNVSRQTLCDWREAGAPIAEACKLSVPEAISLLDGWRKNNKRPRFWSEAEADADGTLQERLMAAQIRKHLADAEAKELKNAVLRGELVQRDDAQLALNQICNLVRVELEGWPDSLQNEWPAEVRGLVTERLDDKVRILLTKLSQTRLEDGSE
jgi:phage terminase Nu1 subunit (DNA packaging protein)